MAKSTPAAQSIEGLKDRFSKLNNEKVRLQTQKERAETDLKELKHQARDQFGTDDLKKLESQLKELKKQNEKKKQEYQAQLDAIDEKLVEVDGQFETAED